MSYDPRQGRWLEADPTGYRDGSNLYLAFSGNPIGLVDPLGTTSASTQPGTQPTTQRSSIQLPGGGDNESRDTITVDIPGVGTVTVHARNDNHYKSGGSAIMNAKITKADGCPCKELKWSQKIHILIHNRNKIPSGQLKTLYNHEFREHNSDPFSGYVLDNGLDAKGRPKPFADPINRFDWHDSSHPFMPGDIGFADGPFTPSGPNGSYPAKADIEKKFILTLYCDGKPLGSIHWSVRGIVGSRKTSTVNAQAKF